MTVTVPKLSASFTHILDAVFHAQVRRTRLCLSLVYKPPVAFPFGLQLKLFSVWPFMIWPLFAFLNIFL